MPHKTGGYGTGKKGFPGGNSGARNRSRQEARQARIDARLAARQARIDSRNAQRGTPGTPADGLLGLTIFENLWDKGIGLYYTISGKSAPFDKDAIVRTIGWTVGAVATLGVVATITKKGM